MTNSLLNFIESSVVENTGMEYEDEVYHVFSKISDDLMVDLIQNDITSTLIDPSHNIYLVKGSKENKFVKILYKHAYAHDSHIPFEFNYVQFLRLALFFINQDFAISKLGYFGQELYNFVVTKEDINMVIWQNGLIHSTIEPTDYLQSFYIIEGVFNN